MKSKKIKNYETYMVFEDGKIYNSKTNKYLKPRINNEGYANIYLHKNGFGKNFKLHRIVAEAFIPNPKNLKEINHKDFNKLNNNVDNLEWCDRMYNVRYSKSKRVSQFTKDNKFIRNWDCLRDVERELGISHGSISHCCSGKLRTAGGYVWKYLERQS